jgi:hypothetical protein
MKAYRVVLGFVVVEFEGHAPLDRGTAAAVCTFRAFADQRSRGADRRSPAANHAEEAESRPDAIAAVGITRQGTSEAEP